MRYVFGVIAIFMLNVSFAGGPLIVGSNTDNPSKSWADSVVRKMSLDEKIGQLFMIAAYSNRDEQHRQKITNLIEEYHIGGLIFFQGGPARQIG